MKGVQAGSTHCVPEPGPRLPGAWPHAFGAPAAAQSGVQEKPDPSETSDPSDLNGRTQERLNASARLNAELAVLARDVRACRACPTMPPERRRVPGCGVARPLVMLIGEAPGRFGADRTGVPFSGDRSGAFLRELMAEAGLSTERNAFITNVVKCNPRDDRGNNRKPTPAECAACRAYLWQEVELLQPRVILTLGDLACRELLGIPIRACVGEPRLHAGRWHLPLYHPSYAASYSYPRPRYRAQFLRIRELLDDPSSVIRQDRPCRMTDDG